MSLPPLDATDSPVQISDCLTVGSSTNSLVQDRLPSQAEVLGQLDAGFTLKRREDLADLVHSTPNSTERFQRWFRYREGFAPELILRALGDLGVPCRRVLDPFCGAGSTLLAARHAGIDSIGFDINPIVTLIARAKTYNYDDQDRRAIEKIVEELRCIGPNLPAAARPKLSILGKVFRADVLDALLTGRQVIDQTDEGRIHDFLLAGWLSILEGVSNTFKEGNGIKYRNRRRTPNGYITIPWEDVPGHSEDGWNLVQRQLATQYATMLDDLESSSRLPVPEIREESSLSGVAQLEPDSISLCLFSPPYCNNFNYLKIFKLELWMSGFVADYKDIRAISGRALRSHVEMKIDVPAETPLPTELLALIGLMDHDQLWNAKIPSTIVAYFLDMRDLLGGVYRSLEPGGKCHIVVGNSAYGGVIVPTDVLLAKIAEEQGFVVDRIEIARHLTTSSQQRRSLGHLLEFLRESVVVLRKD